MNKKFILLICFSLWQIGILSAQELKIIDIESTLEKKKTELKLSDFVESVTYIPLETSSESLLDRVPVLAVNENEIVVKTMSNVKVFNRQDGSFLREIGKKGRGPGEYQYTQGFSNPFAETVYMSGQGASLLKYNFNGEYVKKIIIPGYNGSVKTPSIPTNYTWLNEDVVYYFSDMTGLEEKKMLVCSEEGKTIKFYPNTNFVNERKGYTMNLKESQFYHFNKKLYFKDDYCDTIFQVNSKRLMPQLILFSGKYLRPYTEKWIEHEERKNQNTIDYRNLIETNNYFLFQIKSQKLKYQAVYFKNNGALEIANAENGIEDDVTNFLPFTPLTISTNGQLIGYVEAYQVTEWFRQNQIKSFSLPPVLQKLKNVKESDNLVVVIAKLKE